MTKRNKIIVGVVAAGIIILVVNRIVKSSEIKKINEILDKHINENGEEQSCFDRNYWRKLNIAGTIHMSASDADQSKRSAKIIYDSLGYFSWDNEEKVKGVFRNAANKAMVSMIADSFFQKYNSDLLAFMEKHLSSTDIQKIYDITNNLKEY